MMAGAETLALYRRLERYSILTPGEGVRPCPILAQVADRHRGLASVAQALCIMLSQLAAERGPTDDPLSNGANQALKAYRRWVANDDATEIKDACPYAVHPIRLSGRP